MGMTLWSSESCLAISISRFEEPPLTRPTLRGILGADESGTNPPYRSGQCRGRRSSLGPGISLLEARQDLASIGAALAREFPATNRDHTLSAGLLWDRTLGNVRPALWFLMGAACLFLFIGCANVANLLLARSTARQRNVGTYSDGAGKGRLIRQLLTESCVLAMLGGSAA